MKECPKCGNVYTDESLSFCLADGTPLVSQTGGEAQTEKFSNLRVDLKTDDKAGKQTEQTNFPTGETVIRSHETERKTGVSSFWIVATFGLLGLVLIGVFSVWLFSDRIFGERNTAGNNNADSNFGRELSNLSDENENRSEQNGVLNRTKDIRPDPTPQTTGREKSEPTEKPTTQPSPEETTTPSGNLYKVINVKSNDVLYMRPQPGNLKVEVGRIPPNGTGIIVTGAGKRVGKSIWVPVSYKGSRGWVNSRFIAKQ